MWPRLAVTNTFNKEILNPYQGGGICRLSQMPICPAFSEMPVARTRGLLLAKPQCEAPSSTPLRTGPRHPLGPAGRGSESRTYEKRCCSQYFS